MRGTGELEGINYEENRYEGYGPGGVAVIVETLSDNKNRTVSEVRHTFAKYNGNLGESNCVGWMFSRKGLIVIEKEAIAEDALMELALESGAEDIKTEEDSYEVITAPDDLISVNDAIKAAGIEPFSSEISMIPNNTIHLEGKHAEQALKLLEKLEELDDTQYVWSNADIDEEEEED
jgi:YebC/PmpR family DNA-binding regulatory protein